MLSHGWEQIKVTGCCVVTWVGANESHWLLCCHMGGSKRKSLAAVLSHGGSKRKSLAAVLSHGWEQTKVTGCCVVTWVGANESHWLLCCHMVGANESHWLLCCHMGGSK